MKRCLPSKEINSEDAIENQCGISTQLKSWIEDRVYDKLKCIEYDKKKDECMCVDSPYFIQQCGGTNGCKYYSSNKKLIIQKDASRYSEIEGPASVEIISAENVKVKMCPYCGSKLISDIISVAYRKPDYEKQNKLTTSKCQSCMKWFISDDLFNSYTGNKIQEYISIKFVK